MGDLRLSGLTKALGGRTVVDNVDLTVEPGEMMVVLGPSGCGKTTILRMICGLERADAGSVVVAGREVTDLPPRRRNLGMVFQEYGLYPAMDVFGNMAYGLQARQHAGKQEIDDRIRDVAAQLGLTDLLRRRIDALSGGEQQRVALGRALVKDADAYLFDEPLSNLDPKLRHSARRDILAMHRLRGRPTLFVTHDQNEAVALADRIAIMAEGRIQQVGTPDELLRKPANVFVAGFLGSPPMNLLGGVLTTGDSGPAVAVGGHRLPVPADLHPAAHRHRSGSVVAGVRPDVLVPRRRGDPAGISGTVRDVEPLIGEAVVDLRTDDGDTVVAVLRDNEIRGLRIGARLDLTVAADALCLFDPDTGKALSR